MEGRHSCLVLEDQMLIQTNGPSPPEGYHLERLLTVGNNKQQSPWVLVFTLHPL